LVEKLERLFEKISRRIAMAIVQGIKEKVHLPIYDSLAVEGAQQLREVEATSTLKFFVNVQGKTKLETNLQSASLLPHYNTFEARAMRVVISDLPPEFPDKLTVDGEEFPVTDDNGDDILVDGDGILFEPPITGEPPPPEPEDAKAGKSTKTARAKADAATLPGPFTVVADFTFGLDRLMELLAEARESPDRTTFVDVDDDDVVLKAIDDDDNEVDITDPEVLVQTVLDAGGSIDITVGDIEKLIDENIDEKEQPPLEQLRPNNGSGTIIGKFIYNTVTTLFVGEKIMIQMPTWFFPAGAGPYSETGHFTTHGEPSPLATFRFAEPIYIDKQQNFRVEMEVPDTDTLKEIQRIYGPLNIWVVLDGYMTRDVQ
jgi:hypothetical protein